MEENKENDFRIFLRNLKRNGKSYQKFANSITILQEEASKNGLNNEDMNLLIDVITCTTLDSNRYVSLIKCLIPQFKICNDHVKRMFIWLLPMLEDLPVATCTIFFQWIIGLWEFQLVDRKTINNFYDALFHAMKRKESLQKYIAQLLFVLVKPEDVTRREVTRLLFLQRKSSKPQKHIVALLLLFKSYKPELVPEKIDYINIESVWKTIPEVFHTAFTNAKLRVESEHAMNTKEEYDWKVQVPSKKRKFKSLVPSVNYFQIGSSIFKETDSKSIFEINSVDDLGKYNLSIELPSNITSLLGNLAGYHLLTFSNQQYQSRFSYNLYNTLRRAFILEPDKYSEEEKCKILIMTAEFSMYMQQGIPVVSLFLEEYFCLSTGDFELEILELIKWMTSISIQKLQENVLAYMEKIYYESSLKTKCRIIKTYRILISNLFINLGAGNSSKDSVPFFGQKPDDDLHSYIPIFSEACEKIIISGLNIHSYDLLLLSEVLTFYEMLCHLEHKENIQNWTIAPPAVIYGGFITRNCNVLSRVCSLLTAYNELKDELRSQNVDSNKPQEDQLATYINDIISLLWYDNPIFDQSNNYFIKLLSKNALEDLKITSLNQALNISMHHAVVPYRWFFNQSGINVDTKLGTYAVAKYYYPAVCNFISNFGHSQ